MGSLTNSLKLHYPNITEKNYKHTSPSTNLYNCIAWAAIVDDKWWEPDPYYNYYWPQGVKREYTIEAYMDAYRTEQFEECESSKYEKDFEKIAIYIDSRTKEPLHAARLLENGHWTSKLGQSIDISHTKLSVLEGPKYGVASKFMKRPRLVVRP